MSGRTIGSVVGFAIGAAFGAPQLGMFLGSLAGGALKPDVIQGNKVGEVPFQRSQSGGVQPVVLGASLVDKCVVMHQSAVRIVVEKERQGKGGGPVVENEVAYQDYTVRVCRSSAADGSQVEGFVMVFEDGKLVYDARPTPRISAAESAKWKANVTFYYGGPGQGVDPTEESIDGVGNVSAHRQIARMVFHNNNITDFGNRIPGYEVVVSRCGVTGGGEAFAGQILITGSVAGSSTAVFAIAELGLAPVPVAIPASTGADEGGMVGAYHDGKWVAASQYGTRVLDGQLSTTASWAAGTLTGATRMVEFVGASEDGEWVAKEEGVSGSTAVKLFNGAPDSFVVVSPAATNSHGGAVTMRNQMIRRIDGYWYVSNVRALFRAASIAGPFTAVWDEYDSADQGWDPNGATIIGFYDGVKAGDDTYFIVEWHFNVGLQRIRIWRSPDGGFTMNEANIEWDQGSTDAPRQLIEVGGKVVALCSNYDVITNASGTFARVSTGMPLFPAAGGASGIGPWDAPKIATDGERVYIVGGSYMVVSADKGVTWGDPIQLPISSAKSIAVGVRQFADAGPEIPDSPGHYIDPVTGAIDGPTIGSSSLCGTTLADVVGFICRRGQLDDAEVVTTELEDVAVRGITLQSAGSCKDELSPLQLAHFFDPSEFDGALRFRKRGADAVDVTINPDHLILTDDEDQDDNRTGQPVEFPRRNNLNYLCVDLDYIRTVATETRTAVADNVVGSVDNNINEAMTSQEAQQASAIQLKQAWMAREGQRKFGLPLEYLRIVGASLVSLSGKRLRIDAYTIEPDGIWIDSAGYDRASAATANVVAPELTPPTGPTTSLRGPTDALLMNAPVLADANDKPGITWAATGYPGMNWRGASLQVQRGADWLEIGQITQACGVGTLLSDLPAYDGTFDTVNTLQLRVNEDIDGITFAELLAEGNPLAIVRPDGRTEIVQPQLATETSPGVYACTRIVRGRLDTANASHAAGARVAVLDARLGFAQLRKDDIGKTLTFRAVSIGTDPDAATTQTLTLATMESQREWQPWNVAVEITETCEHRVTFVGRHRLGTDLNPVASQWFKGWRIDFTLNGVTHSRMTQEESFLYTREMQVEDWGVALCAAYDVAVYAVNEYTGTDGAGNPPENDDEPFLVSGNLPDGYVGSAYRIFSGDAGFVLTGKSQATYNDAFGLVGAGVTAHGPEPYSVGFVTRGTPLAAGTYTTDIDAGNAGEIAQSVTFAAKPTYTLLDMRWRGWSEGRWADTTPPLTMQVYEADQRSGTGSMWTLAALGSGDAAAHVEFVVTGADVYIGINARMPAELTDAAFFAGIVYAAPDTVAYLAEAGTYAIELAPSTGAWAIIKLGTGTVASGTLPLPSGNRYRFGYTVPLPQDSTVAFNAGNAAWAITPTGSHAGVAHPSVVVPVGWLDTSPANSVTYGTFGKSSGQWRVQVGGRYRSGLAVAGFDEANGFPGDPGADDSIVFDGATLRWTFGGTADFIDLPWPPSAEPAPVYAIDFAASTVKVCRVDYTTGVVSVIHTITGLPAGTWLPFDFRGYLSKQIKHNPAGPAGYSDWTTTL